MTLNELIKALQQMPGDAQVILQKDGEGNGYSPLAGGSCDAFYDPINGWSGEVFDAEWSADDAGFDSSAEWERFKASTPLCCVLCPKN